jgi:nucleotide-binding universal stress UspA family protein
MDIDVILHPTDGSRDAGKALDLACDLARSHGAKLVIVHVQGHSEWDVPPGGAGSAGARRQAGEPEVDLQRLRAQAVLDAAVAEAHGRGLTDVEPMLVEGDAAGAIVETAKAVEANLIVLGSRGLGDLQSLLLGSVSHKVMQRASCSCLVVR